MDKLGWRRQELLKQWDSVTHSSAHDQPGVGGVQQLENDEKLILNSNCS